MFRNPTLRFHLRTNLKTMLTMYAVITVAYAALTILFSTTIGHEDANFSIGGAGMATTICLLVVGTTVVNEDLLLLSSFGVSRKSQFWNAMAALGITVLGIGLLETIVSLLLAQVLPYYSLFMQTEGLQLAFDGLSFSLFATDPIPSTAGTFVQQMLWYACLYAFMFSIGFLLAAMFKFVPRRYKPFAIAGVIAFFVVLLPYINQLTGNGLARLFLLLYGSGALRHTLFFAGAAVLQLGIGYLFFRKLQLYTVRK